MVERRPLLTVLSHVLIVAGIIVTMFPIYIALVASTHTTERLIADVPAWFGGELVANYAAALTRGAQQESASVARMLFNSTVMALGITVGKISISLLSAYAIVYFRFPLRLAFFWMIFITLMLPVEVRIVPTFQIASNLQLLDSYAGLILPLIASATATFLFRQFFLTVPDELAEAARIDGAGPMRFFLTVLLPLSRTNLAALFVILFIYGWNQYLWPLLITQDDSMTTVVMGIQQLINVQDGIIEWNVAMATAILALLPPAVVVIVMQRQFVRGLVETEK